MKKTILLISCVLFSVFGLISCNSTVQEEKPVVQEQKPAKKTETQLEYERATKDLHGEVVSIETFEMDKRIILEKIQELNVIMKNRDYKSWLGYIDSASTNYWSQKKNLSAVSKQLPVKNLYLKSLEDYFNYVFIPSRAGKRIDEIRYISSTSIKAVQVRDDDIVIFYNFKKVNDEWVVELPVL